MGLLSPFITLSKQHLIFPFYHGLWTFPLPHIEHVYHLLSPEQLEKDLDFLLRYYRPIGLDEVRKSINGAPLPRRNAFHLSFDDGLRSCYDWVRPILLKKGIPATFFLNTDFIDNRALFYRYKASLLVHALQHAPPPTEKVKILSEIFHQKKLPLHKLSSLILALPYQKRFMLDQIAETLHLDFSTFLNRERPYMSSDQIQKLIEDGFSLGGHSESHPYFSELTVEEQVAECINSVSYITNKWGLSYKVFAFPFTDWGVPQSVFHKIYAQGIELSFGTAGLKQDEFPQNLQRIPMEKRPGARNTLWKAYSAYFPKALLNRNVVTHP
ncbi:MAG: polysaccharide deacetylase family protein [Bacteroidota bacterium]